MACCGKTIGHLVEKGKHIVQGNYRVLAGKKCAATDSRVHICRTCESNYWIGRTLWCSICKCFVPAKARVEEEDCPLKKW